MSYSVKQCVDTCEMKDQQADRFSLGGLRHVTLSFHHDFRRSEVFSVKATALPPCHKLIYSVNVWRGFVQQLLRRSFVACAVTSLTSQVDRDHQGSGYAFSGNVLKCALSGPLLSRAFNTLASATSQESTCCNERCRIFNVPGRVTVSADSPSDRESLRRCTKFASDEIPMNTHRSSAEQCLMAAHGWQQYEQVSLPVAQLCWSLSSKALRLGI